MADGSGVLWDIHVQMLRRRVIQGGTEALDRVKGGILRDQPMSSGQGGGQGRAVQRGYVRLQGSMNSEICWLWTQRRHLEALRTFFESLFSLSTP